MEKIKTTITRLGTGDEGTFGILTTSGFTCRTLELPWRKNQRKISCVPAGIYLFKWRTDSPTHGECYEEWDDPTTPEREDVADRDYVQIHSANLAGDEAKGYAAQLEGCIALGRRTVVFPGGLAPAGEKDQRGITMSRDTVKRFVKFFAQKTIQLEIRWARGLNPEQLPLTEKGDRYEESNDYGFLS